MDMAYGTTSLAPNPLEQKFFALGTCHFSNDFQPAGRGGVDLGGGGKGGGSSSRFLFGFKHKAEAWAS